MAALQFCVVQLCLLLASAVSGQPRLRYVLTDATPAAQRCSAALGSWCTEFHAQTPVTWKPAPRGSKPCPNNCNTVGNCNADTGYCECPAGWTGPDCSTHQYRPCTNRLRSCGTAHLPPFNHTDKDGRDIDLMETGGTQSRCAGVCDNDIAMCWCDGPKGRIPAPKGSPPGTPPIRVGRPMTTPECQPKNGKMGEKLGLGAWNTWENIYGPKGWCVADEPEATCPCIIDGLAGRTCEEPVEHFCINQCSGHGECNLGFCKCDPGWYGHDCSRKVAGQPLEASRIGKHRWLQGVALEPPAAKEPVPAPTRKRPLIYVYDLEPLYSSKLLQYRIPSSWCVHRRYHQGNMSQDISNWVYSVDTMLHENLLQSEHRTFDPEEADWFYVPQYSVCYIFPIQNWADYPWFGIPGTGHRVSGASMLLKQVHSWISTKFPYWNRRNGRDHIFFFPHDEGACWVPNVLVNATWLTHWGRMGREHTSYTAFPGDDYNVDDKTCPSVMPGGWRQHMLGHACYNESKDLVIPSHKPALGYAASPLLGSMPRNRSILFFFRGDVGKNRLPNYSRQIRQKIYKLAQDGNWKAKYNVQIGDSRDVPGDYSELLSSSLFCLVAPGDGFSARMVDSTLNGCIPVVIMDGVHAEFESILDFSEFAIRVAEKDIPNILQILQAVPSEQIRKMQAKLSRVWHRFRWSFSPQQRSDAQTLLDRNLARLDTARRQRQQQQPAQRRKLQQSSSTLPRLPRPFRGDVSVDDAFATIMQWLYSRIPHTR